MTEEQQAARAQALLLVLNAVAAAVVVVLSDPGLRREVAWRWTVLGRRLREGYHRPVPEPSPTEVSALLAEAEAITRGGK